MQNIEHLCAQTVTISKAIGNWIVTEREQFSLQSTEEKSFNNLVSYVDKSSEKRFTKELLALLPNSGILGEEGTSINLDADYIWIVDPLDGTTNFVHGIPAYCTSVALQYKKETILGVVYEPNSKECFYAWKDGGAYLNSKKIQVSSSKNLNQTLLATGFPYDDFDRMKNYLEVLQYFMQTTRGIRRIGAAALDLSYVACGRFDAFYEYALQPWDVAAGSFIVQEAGGKVSDFKNEDNFIFGTDIIASNATLHKVVQEKIFKLF